MAIDYKRLLRETDAKRTARLIAKYGLGRNGHSHFSASGSAGWLNCMGYVLANAEANDVAGVDAAYGTVAHEVAAVWLAAIRDQGREVAEHVPQRFLGFRKIEDGHEIEVDAPMLGHIRSYIDWCAEVEHEGDVFIEEHVGYDEYMPIPKQGGTADHFVCSRGRAVISDLKMGIGVPVRVEETRQPWMYALGVYLKYNWIYGFEEIVIRICQPRLDYYGVLTITRAELLAFGEEVRAKAVAGWVENAPRTPSEKACRWCKDLGCVARAALLEDLADDWFEPGGESSLEDIKYSYTPREAELKEAARMEEPPRKSLPEPERVDTRVLAWRLLFRSMYEKWFNDIYEELLKRAGRGQAVPGWVLADGRKSYNWTDDDFAAEELSVMGLRERDIFKTSVVSVAQATELLKGTGLKPKQIRNRLFQSPSNDPDAMPMAYVSPGRPALVRREKTGRADINDEIDEAFSL